MFFKKLFKRNKKKSEPEIKSDVLGMYTGKGENPFDYPQQDADDL